jgi:hypothetical protein
MSTDRCEILAEQGKAAVDSFPNRSNRPKKRVVREKAQAHAKGRAVVCTDGDVVTRYEDAHEAAKANYRLVGTIYEWIKKGRVWGKDWRYE